MHGNPMDLQSHQLAPVLATFVIRSPNWTFLDIFLCLPYLRMSQRKSRIASSHLLIFIKGKLIL